MKASELVEKLNTLIDRYGDLTVEIDSQAFVTTLPINDAILASHYIGSGMVIYIYPEIDDANQLISDAIETGYERARNKL